MMLQDASHQLVMITGDTPLTACHAAKQVHIVDRPVLILDYHRSAPQLHLTVPHKTHVFSLALEAATPSVFHVTWASANDSSQQ